ncbi:hypothetical protein [Rhizobium phaseoli]|uniref:hypothetical protein n=1 Tax=Rhizobium phaseoli TaxID=396 RepID=UPI002553E432|nr:hypothetical protein [Rhizobium phaseoli]MDK4729363.1 hypothetical protein [Rhizobium phaseoli]
MSGGYAYGDAQPTESCPYCGATCEADFVDVGIGYTQCGPYHCEDCLASEIGPYDEKRELSEDERRTGWYRPGAEPGSSANVIGGKIVGHATAKRVYRDEFYNNPRWEDKDYVANWWADQRKGGAA